MRKILAIFVLLFAIFGSANDDNATEKIVFPSVIKQLQTLNSQIKILSTENNQSGTADTLKTLQQRKKALLERIPIAIINLNAKSEDKKKFIAQKTKLERTISSIDKKSNAYKEALIALEKMEVDEIFFKNILELQNLFTNGASDKQLKSTLDNALLELGTNSHESIKILKDIVGSDEKTDGLELYKQTCEEILTYLKENASLLASNKILADLNIKTAIDTINKHSPRIDGINFGKIIAIALTLLFFISLTQILARITYYIAISLFAKNIHAEEIKDQVVTIIKRPISALLITYALSLCFAIAYQPAPTPISIANCFLIAYIVGFAWLTLTILNGYGILMISELTKKSGRKEIVNLILKITYFIVIVIAFLAILARLGFNVSALIASLGIGGLAVAFAAKDIIANFFASVMLVFDNSFSQGDWIVCDGIEGTVVEIGLRKTTLRSFDNALLFVPNSKLASEPIINWSRRKVGRIIDITIGITYDSKRDDIIRCIDQIRQMLLSHPKISTADNGGSFSSSQKRINFRKNIVSIDDLAGYKSDLSVNLVKLSESSIDIAVNCFAKTTKKAEFLEIKQEIILNIMQIVGDNNLSFAFPSQSLYVQNDAATAIFEQNNKI